MPGRPGIISPTRKQAGILAEELGRLVPTAAYHAGLDAEHRNGSGGVSGRQNRGHGCDDRLWNGN
jgi:hypothetical protein